jgi:hypothetical protein
MDTLTNASSNMVCPWTITDATPRLTGYWLNFLWKRTLGTSVYNVTTR